MPVTTPPIKVQAVADLGGEVVLHGDVYDAAYEHALKIAAERQLVFVHPFDDPDVIAGQGTIGMELLRQSPGDIDAVFIAVGGGGLIGGVAAYIKYLSPRTKIIGVEPEDAAAMHESLRQGRRVTLDHVGIFADSVAVKRVARKPSRWRASTWTRSCSLPPTRSAPPSRTPSRTRARCPSPRARWASRA